MKWHNHRAFKPTRDFNADDVIFGFERQWKEANPYFKVTSSNHSYFNDMGMPKLLKSVDKVDDYTVRITLEQAGSAVPVQPRDALRRRSSRRNTPIAMLKAGTPEKIDQEPIGTGPFYLVQYQKDAVDPLQGLPAVLGRQGQDRRPGLRDHARRLGALGQAAEGRVPRDAVSESGRPGRDPQGPERAGAGAGRA